jgi:hypothetical protein
MDALRLYYCALGERNPDGERVMMLGNPRQFRAKMGKRVFKRTVEFDYFTCEMTGTCDGFRFEWTPALPQWGPQFTPADFERYKAARAELMAQVANHIGKAVLIVDVSEFVTVH